MRCNECGARVTAERQKGHNYYRCTKKLGPCNLAGYIREEFLAAQMQTELHLIGNPEERSGLMLGQTDAWRREGIDHATAVASTHQTRLAEIEAKVQRLLDVFLDGAITREEYAARKAEYFTEKARLREKIAAIKARGNCWLEPLENFLRLTKQAENMAISGDFSEMRGFFQKIGSNLYLRQPKAGEIEEENRMHPPSERSGQKAETAARRGGLAARADLPNPQETPPIPAAAPLRKSLYPSLKVRASRARRPAPENAWPAKGRSAAPDLAAVGRWSPHRVSNRGNLPPRLRVEYFGPWKIWAEMPSNLRWSGRLDLNQRLLGPEPSALPG